VPVARVRALTPDDAAALQALRLAALRESPDAFGSTYEEEADTPLATIAERLRDGEADRSSFILGALDADGGDRLVGLAACFRQRARKERHRATVGGMYVAPEVRGRGIGAQLLDAVVVRARARWPELEQLTLTVVPTSAAARALYLSRGFRSFGVAPRALKEGDHRYADLEHLWLPLTVG
jgi:ribosomal protein S18 acetylase RimI-like enzyme